ncbi:efflux RND transporter periplasmic adaptor subunit [Gimesia fumaroli]|jgi:multidrug efflux pump subunit AcrA (membrane-fusion protein)|uniref:Efflux pump periplasmic linker BepF n=1 Tax=Gimesia fumaroli TaxID=2527976 RepID=A0A518IDY0_9PLAN|nr:efflux RND transporter periplasmic adaptor subunit [Gimesia fumaroli]QDV51311.1 Efflux pump periplasmic linker BepF [Gimesia fumaroli]
MKRFQLLLFTFILIGVPVAFWEYSEVAFSTELADTNTKQVGVPVEVVKLKPVKSFVRQRSYTGRVAAARTSELAFERSGKLINVAVDEGDTVQENMVLANLNTRHLEVVRLQLQAERAAAQAKLNELKAGPRQQTIAVAEAEARQLSSRLKNLKADHARNEELLKRNAISKSVFEASQYDVEQQQAQLDAAQNRLSELKEGTRKEQIDAQTAVVANLDASLADNQVDLDDAVLKAPFSGRISKRYADEGTVIPLNVPLFRLVEDQKLEAHIGVPVEMAGNLERGTQQAVQLNGKSYEATLKAILPELDPVTRTQEVVLALNSKASQSLVPGQVIRITISEPIQMQGFWLPLSALARGERGLWSAYAVVDGTQEEETVLEKRQIEVLHTEGDRVLVRGTLQTGDQIVVDGIHKLANRQPVVVKSIR